MESYDEIKWRLDKRHVDRLDKIKFLEKQLYEKDKRIHEIEAKLKHPLLRHEPEPADNPDKIRLRKMSHDVKELMRAGKHEEAEHLVKKLNISVAIAEARKEFNPALARQKLMQAEQLLAESHLPSNDIRKLHLQIEEVKTEIKMQKI